MARPIGSGTAALRLSLVPLLQALSVQDIDPESLSIRHYAAIRKARMTGSFSLAMADEIACDVLQQHPFFIWGEEYARKMWHDIDGDHEPDPSPAGGVVVSIKRGRPRSYTYMGTGAAA